MKYMLFALLTFLPSLLSAQNLDSIPVVQELDSLIRLSQGAFADQKEEKALQFLEQAKAKADIGLGKIAEAYATRLHAQVNFYVKMGKFSDALPCCMLAKDIREKVLGKEHLDYSLSLSYLATLYKELAQYDKAEPLALEAKEIRAKIPGKTSREYAITLHLLGTVYYKLGQYEKSESYFLEAITIFAIKPGKASQEYALALSNLAALYFDWGKYEKIEGLYLEAKAIQGKFPGKKSAAYASTLNNLAWFYFKTGQYNKAEPLFIEARQLFAKLFGKKHENYVSTLTNLASLYYEIGQYGRAELLFLQAKNILGKNMGKENRSYPATLTNLADLYADIGQRDKAEANYLDAKNILEKTLGKNHADYAMALANLGNLYYKTGKATIAETLFLEAKDIRQKVLGNEHPDYATSLHNLAQLYSDNRQYEKAEPLFLEARDIWAKTLGLSHPSYASSLQNLAQLYALKGDFGKATSLFLEAKEIFAEALSKDHPNYVAALSGLARLYRSTNRLSESAPLFLELNGAIRRLIEKSAAYFSEKEMLAYLQTYEVDLAQFQSFSQTYSSPELIRASFNNALFYNGYLLENACHLDRSIANADSLTRDIYERWQGCRRRLAKEYAKPITERRFVAETEAEAEGYEKTLTRNLPRFKEALRAEDWQDVRDRLRAGEAAVEFIHYRYYTPNPTDSILYAALVLLPDDTMPYFIPLFEERELQTLFNRSGFDKKLAIKDLYGNSPDLRQLLWQPLEPLLREVKTIYYSPAGLLYRINPAALQDESKQLLSEGRQWVRVGSTRELLSGHLANQSFARMPKDSMLAPPLSAVIYGGITYDMDSLAYTLANPAEPMDSTGYYQPKDGNFRYITTDPSSTKVRGSSNSDGSWDTLASTGREADVVNTLLLRAGFRTELRKDFYASEERFKQIGIQTHSPLILHLATHGFAYPDPKKDPPKVLIGTEPTYKLLDDPMLRSGLVLAGANYYYKNKRPLTNFEDGMLVAYEVRDLNLQNTELAVLSACQTGLGDVVGSEGVYGLHRAFRIAGAKFLIVSLWEVPDEQTQELMRLFYQNWLEKKESLRDAFNHAQQTLKEYEPNPYLWAGFVLVE